jgi:formylglycine-generating enzyme required for sulfatase activity
MDEREITVAQYARCVAAGRCHERIPRGVSVALTKNGDAMPQPDLSWSDAADYCTFVGLGLPTEAQWVRAARAEPLDAYPWGQAQPGLPPARANLGEKPGHGLPHYELADPDSSWTGDGVAGLAEGCSFALGRGPFGHCDLIGNLLEWVEGSLPFTKPSMPLPSPMPMGAVGSPSKKSSPSKSLAPIRVEGAPSSDALQARARQARPRVERAR